MALPFLNQFMRRRSSQPVFTAEREKDNVGKPIYHHAGNSSPAGGVIGGGNEDFFEITTVDPIDLSQSLNFSDIVEVGDQLLNARSVLNYAERSDNSFEILMKLVGNAADGGLAQRGTKPNEDFLVQRLFGKGEALAGWANPYTGTATNAYQYTFRYDGQTFQIGQVVDSYMLKVANGSYCSGGSMEISREGALSMTINTRSSKISYAGTSAISNSQGTVGAMNQNQLEVENAAHTMFVGCMFFVMNEEGNVWNNAGAYIAPPNGSASNFENYAYVVTSIDSATGYIDCETLADVSAGVTGMSNFGSLLTSGEDAAVVPILQTYKDNTTANRVKPTTGEVVPQGSATIFLGDKDITLAQLLNKTGGQFDNQFLGSTFSMNVEKNLGDPGVQELTGDLYPAPVYVAQDITVSGSMGMVLRPKEVYRLNRALDEYEQSLAIVIDPPTSTLSARHIIIFMPRVRLSFTSNEVEGAEGANIDWMLTRPSTATTDADVFSMYIV